MTHWPGCSNARGTVTRTGTSRSTVVQTVAAASCAACQQTRSSELTRSVGGYEAVGTPQATVMAGSPYAAFWSAPAVTGRRARSRSAPGSSETKVRQTAAARGGNAVAVIGTGVVG